MCPDCGDEFEHEQGLATHRTRIHGGDPDDWRNILAKKYRDKVAEDISGITPNGHGNNQDDGGGS